MKKKYTLLAVCLAALLLTGCEDKTAKEIEEARTEGIASMDQGQYEQAVASFERAYSLCDEKMPETKADICLYEAACQMKLKNYEQAREAAGRALEQKESADASYIRGTASLQLGDMDMAKADYDWAAELEPGNYEMLLNIYRQYESVSQSAVGDVYLQKALNYEGETVQDAYQKGRIYYYLGDYANAQTILAKPVEDKDEASMLLMGETYLAQQDSAQARNLYQQYIQNFGETAAAYNGLALCGIEEGAYDQALTDIQSGLALEASEENKRDLLYNEIVVYEKKLDFETAKQKAAEFVEMYPQDAEGQKEYDFLSTR